MNEQKRRWGKGAIALIATAVVFLLVAGSSGTLWIIERDEHSATSEQLPGLRAQVHEARTKLRDAEGRTKTMSDKLQEIVNQERAHDIVRERRTNCATAGRDFAGALRSGDDKAYEDAHYRLQLWC